MKKTEPRTIRILKRKAKEIKKRGSDLPLMWIQHNMANHLGFRKWGDLLTAGEGLREQRILENPIGDL